MANVSRAEMQSTLKKLKKHYRDFQDNIEDNEEFLDGLSKGFIEEGISPLYLRRKYMFEEAEAVYNECLAICRTCITAIVTTTSAGMPREEFEHIQKQEKALRRSIRNADKWELNVILRAIKDLWRLCKERRTIRS